MQLTNYNLHALSSIELCVFERYNVRLLSIYMLYDTYPVFCDKACAFICKG